MHNSIFWLIYRGFHSTSDIRTMSLQRLHVFSIFKISFKVPESEGIAPLRHCRLLCHHGHGTAGGSFCRRWSKMGQQLSLEKGSVKNLIISHCIWWMNFFSLLLLMLCTSAYIFKTTKEAPLQKDAKACTGHTIFSLMKQREERR